MTRDEASIYLEHIIEADRLILRDLQRNGRAAEACSMARDIVACKVALQALKTATWEPNGAMYKCSNCGNIEAAPDRYCRMCGAYCRKVVGREE